ncbi:MAG: choice-of-anchor D domain-containing protein [Acidobacteriales bacterium]|nr:choice-of-anchor D domain-containing protein [Terriglobales bacterium]
MKSAHRSTATFRYAPSQSLSHTAWRALLIGILLVGAASAQVNSTVNVEMLYSFPTSPFPYPNGIRPLGNVIEMPGSPGVFLTTASQYGGSSTCDPYGLNGCGTLVKIDTTIADPKTRATVVHFFTGLDGGQPIGNLVSPGNGKIYGVTQYGGNQPGGVGGGCPYGCGTVYQFDLALGTLTTIHSFSGDPDGQQPTGLVVGKDSTGATVLYGTTLFGGPIAGPCGASVLGTLFTIAPPYGAAQFSSSTCFPIAIQKPNAPMQAGDGKLYGSAAAGVLWMFDPSAGGLPTILSPSDSLPKGRLVEASDGALYGASQAGGTGGIGSLFRFDRSGPTFSTLYSFLGGTDGANSQGGLMLSSCGVMYGTTIANGDPLWNVGTIFRLVPGSASTPTTLHAFVSNAEGGRPFAELTEASDGLIYGTATFAGVPPDIGGTVFRFGQACVPTWIHQDGRTAIGSIASDSTGRIYVFGETSVDLGGAGSGTYFIARYKNDGTIDTTFGGVNGFVQFGPVSSAGSLARIVVDVAGNSYVTGSTDQSFFGFTNKGGTDVFVASFDSSGGFRWGFMFGTPQFDTVQDLAVDASQNVYLTGSTLGNLGGPLQGVQDAFLSVLTPSKQLTSFQWGVAAETRSANGVAYCTDPLGAKRLYVGGADFSSGNGWISRFNPAGITSGPQQTQTLLGAPPGDKWGLGHIATDAQCNPYVVGAFTGGQLTHFIVQKYDPLLANPATLEIDGPAGGPFLGAAGAGTITLDALNNIYVAGAAPGPQTLFGNNIAGLIAAWYGVYDPTGKRLRAGVIDAGPGSQTGGTIALDPAANIYIGGFSDSPLADGQTKGSFLAQFPAVVPAFRAVSLSATKLKFGKVPIKQTSAPMSVTLTNTGTATVNISSIAPSGDYAIFNNTCGLTVAPGANCIVSVTFTPTKKGARNGNLTFTDDAPGSPQIVALVGTGVSLVLSPTSLNFGTVTVGNTSPSQTGTTSSPATPAAPPSRAEPTAR